MTMGEVNLPDLKGLAEADYFDGYFDKTNSNTQDIISYHSTGTYLSYQTSNTNKHMTL